MDGASSFEQGKIYIPVPFKCLLKHKRFYMGNVLHLEVGREGSF
jgi:hypothetical protein